MRKAIDTGADCVVVAGGDGSIACAAAALAGGQAALGLIPCGTMNLLARDLGLNPDDHAAAITTLAAGAVRQIDVGCVQGADGEDHLFLCASMLGTPARLSRHREAGRRSGGGLLAWLGFGRAAARALVANHSIRVTLRCNGQVLHRHTPSLTITLNRLDDESGAPVRPIPAWMAARWSSTSSAACRSGGRPGCCCARPPARRCTRREIEVIETTELEIQSPKTALHVLVDGEIRLLAPTLRYTVRPRALRVIGAAATPAA